MTKKEVALTFDDGNSFVSEILDLLKENEIHATFFITGNNIKYKATLRKRAIAEGHQICNHTVSHNYSLTPLTLEKEIEEREEMYEKYL
ncbi:MAG: polysaccharide deacetylase family protein [Candidatus Peribacteria bacterium]|nr:polysaccharide deacetylase family protein [Candidatus Peribacteria bacterium]